MVGLSRSFSSAAENGKRSTTRVRSGINNRIKIGNPTVVEQKKRDASVQHSHE